jgi:hypothetical protein
VDRNLITFDVLNTTLVNLDVLALNGLGTTLMDLDALAR